jgi:hypothetical protein
MKLDSNFQACHQILDFEKNAPKLELKGSEIEEPSSSIHTLEKSITKKLM